MPIFKNVICQKTGETAFFSLALDNFTQVEADIRPIYEQSRQNKIPTHRIGMPYVVKFYAYLFVTNVLAVVIVLRWSSRSASW